MPTIDGISRSRPAEVSAGPQPRAATLVARQRSRATRGGSLLFLILVLGFGTAFIVLLDHEPAVSVEPEATSNNTASAAPDSSLLPVPESEATAATELVVLDQPRAMSAPQATTTTPTPINADATLPTVRILNGGAPQGAAAALQRTLESKGYTVVSIGNARTTYATTTLYFAAGHESAAAALIETVSLSELTKEESDIAEPANILVVLGSDWK